MAQATFTLSATDVAIRLASREGTLRMEEKEGRFGPYVAICDQFGLIEVVDTMAEAMARKGACA